nr:recombinase family protein [Streptomyces sp. SID5468]
MLELSWDGFVEHTKQGWNIGKPPYGYVADKVPHPVPARRAEGRTKHRLVADPVRGPVVTEIFCLRALAKLSYRAITERLSLDPHRYPPPEPTRRDAAVGQWTESAVRGILENPKYTGYQVWNRRARKKGNRANPMSDWVWSPQPTHEPLVTREMFAAASPIAKLRQGSRPGAQPNRHPQTKRTYLLRSYVICALCGRRMFGQKPQRAVLLRLPAPTSPPPPRTLVPHPPQECLDRRESPHRRRPRLLRHPHLRTTKTRTPRRPTGEEHAGPRARHRRTDPGAAQADRPTDGKADTPHGRAGRHRRREPRDHRGLPEGHPGTLRHPGTRQDQTPEATRRPGSHPVACRRHRRRASRLPARTRQGTRLADRRSPARAVRRLPARSPLQPRTGRGAAASNDQRRYRRDPRGPHEALGPRLGGSPGGNGSVPCRHGT